MPQMIIIASLSLRPEGLPILYQFDTKNDSTSYDIRLVNIDKQPLLGTVSTRFNFITPPSKPVTKNSDTAPNSS